MKAKAPLQREEGFTLLELMIAFMLLSVIVFGAFNLMDVNIRAGTVYTMRSDISQDLREVSSTFVDQIRTARSFTTAETDDVVFTSYLTGTNDLYNVEFFLQGTEIIHRASTGALGSGDDLVLAGDVVGLVFTYYDSTGTELTAPVTNLAAIAIVEVRTTISKTSGSDTLTESVTNIIRVRK